MSRCGCFSSAGRERHRAFPATARRVTPVVRAHRHLARIACRLRSRRTLLDDRPRRTGFRTGEGRARCVGDVPAGLGRAASRPSADDPRHDRRDPREISRVLVAARVPRGRTVADVRRTASSMGSPTARCTRMPSAERSCSPSSSMWPTGRYGIESGRCHGRTWWLPGSDIRWPDGSSAGSGRIRVARCGPRWPADRRFTESPRRGRCPARAVSATTPRRRAACLPSRRSRSRSRARAGRVDRQGIGAPSP